MPETALPRDRPRVHGCMEASVRFLAELEGVELEDDEPPDLWGGEPHEWKAVLARWVRRRLGKPLRCYQGRPRRRPSIAVGWSPRDPRRVRHAVVVDREGRLLFDPHPDGLGVVRPSRWWWW